MTKDGVHAGQIISRLGDEKGLFSDVSQGYLT